MVTRDRGSEEADPVQDHSSLSLFLKTFELSEDASEPYDFDLRLQSVQNSLKSTVSRSPDKLRELARNIVNESSKNLSSKPPNDQVSMEKHSEVLPVAAEVYPRERRPGLGSKRARFFIKPDSSQHVVNIEPKLDVKNLSDPEEFFKVHERRENAKKEIQRQMGVVLSDSELQNTSLTNRPRRPGLLDRNKRIAKYKHLYPSDDFETNSNLVSSQEKIDSNILNHESHGSEEGIDRDFASQGIELAGSISAEVEKVDEILDQLLSFNRKELEDDRVMSVLREHLQIKPIELPKLKLPDFPEMPKMNVTSAKLRFSSITHMNVTQESESSVHVVASPKSPFASLPLLNRRILRSSPSSDPFSAHAIDLEPITSPSITDAARQSTTDSPLPEVDKNIELPSTSKTNLDKTLDVGPSASHLTGADDMDINTDNGVVNDKLVAQDVDVSTQANETVVQDKVSSVLLDAGSSASHLPRADDMDISMDNGFVNDKLVAQDVDVSTQANESVVQDKVSSVLLDAGSSASHLPRADDMDISMDNGFVNDKLVAQDVDGSTQANETNVQAEVEDEVQGMADTAQPHSITEDVALNNGSEEHIEINQEQSKEPLDKKRKAKSQSGKAPKRREVEMRKSLAGAGTTWEAGLRRSTRIRFRPLEHWKGERLVFGRVHNTLPTVIGLKYASPGKSGALKVKSYVSDEYKELLELAALH